MDLFERVRRIHIEEDRRHVAGCHAKGGDDNRCDEHHAQRGGNGDIPGNYEPPAGKAHRIYPVPQHGSNKHNGWADEPGEGEHEAQQERNRQQQQTADDPDDCPRYGRRLVPPRHEPGARDVAEYDRGQGRGDSPHHAASVVEARADAGRSGITMGLETGW